MTIFPGILNFLRKTLGFRRIIVATPRVMDIVEKPSPNFKKNSYKSIMDNKDVAFSYVPINVFHTKDV